MVQPSGHRIYDAVRCCTMPYDAVKLGKNPALPGPVIYFKFYKILTKLYLFIKAPDLQNLPELCFSNTF